MESMPNADELVNASNRLLELLKAPTRQADECTDQDIRRSRLGWTDLGYRNINDSKMRLLRALRNGDRKELQHVAGELEYGEV